MKYTLFIFAFVLSACSSTNPPPLNREVASAHKVPEWAALQGLWKLKSKRSCAKIPNIDDPLFQFMKDYSVEFKEKGVMVETLLIEDKENNRECSAEITYKVEMSQGGADEGPLSYMTKMELTRTDFKTKCLVTNIRPEKMSLSLLAYPELLETYELMKDLGPCPTGDMIVTQLKKQSK